VSVDPSLTAVLPALTLRLPRLLDDVQAALADSPDYARFLRDNRAEVTASAGVALHRIVTMAGDDPGAGLDEGDLFEEIGRIQWRQGNDLGTLLTAYQTGARVCWHHVSELAVDSGISPSALAALAEAVFAFVDRLSSASAHGYVLEQSESTAARERLRDELVGLLLSDRADQAVVRAAAARAEWRVPDELAVVLFQPDNPLAHRLVARLDAVHLGFSRPPRLGAILASPSRPGVRRRLTTALRGSGAVVGVAVAPEHLPASAHIAEIAVRLQQDGVLTEDPVFTDEHLDAIIVHRDQRLLDALRLQVLSPLDRAAPSSRDRLCETLASWLRHMGDRNAIATELHVHPQTVRYRLARLHELFGDQLDDPAMRSRLTLALAWAPTRPGSAATPA
jgi:PucR C-terminal helix-turn-helix domain